MNTKEYNGWTNYETWAVNLWLDNDEGSQSYWLERAQDCYDNADCHVNVISGIWTRDESARFMLADELKESHEERADEIRDNKHSDVFTDLLNAALSEVNWDEIAGHMIEAAQDQAAA